MRLIYWAAGSGAAQKVETVAREHLAKHPYSKLWWLYGTIYVPESDDSGESYKADGLAVGTQPRRDSIIERPISRRWWDRELFTVETVEAV